MCSRVALSISEHSVWRRSGWKCAGVVALAALLLAGGCTEENPAFQADSLGEEPVVDAAPSDGPAPDTVEPGDSPAPGPEAATPDGPKYDTTPPGAEPAPDGPPPPDARDAADAGGLGAGLVAFWKLDDEPTSTMAFDATRRGHTGNLIGIDPGSAWVAGWRGGALQLTGDPSSSGVAIPRTPVLDSLQTFTLSAWVLRPRMTTGKNSIISRQIDDTYDEVFNLTFSDNLLNLYLPARESSLSRLISSAPTPLNTWVHVAATFDGQRARLYQQGQEVGSMSHAYPLPGSSRQVYVGTNKNPTVSEPMIGRLDEVAVYDRALSPAEIGALAGGASPLP